MSQFVCVCALCYVLHCTIQQFVNAHTYTNWDTSVNTSVIPYTYKYALRTTPCIYKCVVCYITHDTTTIRQCTHTYKLRHKPKNQRESKWSQHSNLHTVYPTNINPLTVSTPQTCLTRRKLFAQTFAHSAKKNSQNFSHGSALLSERDVHYSFSYSFSFSFSKRAIFSDLHCYQKKHCITASPHKQQLIWTLWERVMQISFA